MTYLILPIFSCKGSGWLRIVSPNTCYQNGWYKKSKEQGEGGTFVYDQVVDDSAVRTWQTEEEDPNQQKNKILYWAKEDLWHLGW